MRETETQRERIDDQSSSQQAEYNKDAHRVKAVKKDG